MNYLTAIKTAIIVFPMIALLFTIPFVLYEYHKYGSIHPLRTSIIFSFILYMTTIYFLVILPLPNKSEITKPCRSMIELIPFSFIKDFLRETSFTWNQPHTYLKALTEPCFYVIIFNIIMTIPFGMYLRYYFTCSRKKTILCSFFLSLFFEVTQLTGLYFIYPYPYRIFDVDDLILNTLGGFLGYQLMGRISKILPTRTELDQISRKNGQKISGLRRITIFFLDACLYLLITLWLSIDIHSPFLKLYTGILYYLIIPYLTNGSTIGEKFLNTKLVCNQHSLLHMTLRILFLYSYYFTFPYFLINYTIHFIPLKGTIPLMIYLLAILILTLYPFISILTLLRHQSIFYDKWLQAKLVSTIQEEKREE